MRSGTLVAAGMAAMNVATYGFTLMAARLLAPQDFGAFTALAGIILVGTVAQLALQAVTARRIAVAPDELDEIVASALRVTVVAASAVGVVVAASTVVMTPALRLDSYWLVGLCGLTLVPMTVMGTQSGIAQGTDRWAVLAAIYVGNGLGRLLGGTIGLLVSPTPTAAMVGVAVGAWLPVVAGASVLRGLAGTATRARTRAVLREAMLSTQALLAFFVLSNLDALIARNRFEGHESGLYASGLILAKAAFFLPQFVSVVLYPDLARATTHHARLRAASLVGLLGAAAVAGTALLPGLALVLVGGDKYAEVRDRLWLFALAGSLLAVVYLLVFDALARHAHGVLLMVWAAVVAVVAGAYGLDVGITGLVTTMVVVTATLSLAVGVAPLLLDRRSRPHG